MTSHGFGVTSLCLTLNALFDSFPCQNFVVANMSELYDPMYTLLAPGATAADAATGLHPNGATSSQPSPRLWMLTAPIPSLQQYIDHRPTILQQPDAGLSGVDYVSGLSAQHHLNHSKQPRFCTNSGKHEGQASVIVL